MGETMVKDDTIILIAALGLGGYLLAKPISNTASGLGQNIVAGTRGVAQGLSTAGSSTGEAVADVVGGVGAPFEFVDNFLNRYDQQQQLKFETQLEYERAVWEAEGRKQQSKAEGAADREEEKQRVKTLIVEDQEPYKRERAQEWQEFQTEWTDVFLTKPSEIKANLSKQGEFIANNKMALLGAPFGLAGMAWAAHNIAAKRKNQDQVDRAKKAQNNLQRARNNTKPSYSVSKSSRTKGRSTANSGRSGQSTNPSVGLPAGTMKLGKGHGSVKISKTRYMKGHPKYTGD